MKTISRYIMTLVALLALTTQAWATDVYVVGNGNGEGTWLNGAIWDPSVAANKMTEQNGVYSITFTNVGANPELLFKFAINGTWNENFGCSSWDANELNKTNSNIEADGNNILFGLTEPADVTISFNLSELTYMISTNGMKVGDDTPVAWNAATKTGTFAMPASNVVLTPIYSAATVYDANQTEKGSYETFKEAFLAAQNGDVIKLDWDVTVTSKTDLMTGNRATEDPVQFTIDFNGHVLDGSGVSGAFMNTNHVGDQIRFIDSSTAQTGGLKGVLSGKPNSFVFESGRYSFNGLTVAEIEEIWSTTFVPFGYTLPDGKEFVDIENAPVDGFMVYVDWKTYELTIGAGKFATFYAEQDFKVVEGTSIGLYTIMTTGIDLDNNQITTSALNGSIIGGETPVLVYNGGSAQQTVKLQVTTETAASQMHASAFQGTDAGKTFTETDMAAKDYYVLSGGSAFAPVKGKGTIAAHKCWLEFAKNNGNARQLTIVFDSEATGIRSMDNGQLIMDNWYDLNGRKLNAKPTRKGVYIKNGQKVVK